MQLNRSRGTGPNRNQQRSPGVYRALALSMGSRFRRPNPSKARRVLVQAELLNQGAEARPASLHEGTVDFRPARG